MRPYTHIPEGAYTGTSTRHHSPRNLSRRGCIESRNVSNIAIAMKGIQRAHAIPAPAMHTDRHHLNRNTRQPRAKFQMQIGIRRGVIRTPQGNQKSVSSLKPNQKYQKKEENNTGNWSVIYHAKSQHLSRILSKVKSHICKVLGKTPLLPILLKRKER